MDQTAKDIEVKQCAACGAAFECAAGSGKCWCFGLPKVVAVPAGNSAACLCPACLKAKIETVSVNIRKHA